MKGAEALQTRRVPCHIREWGVIRRHVQRRVELVVKHEVLAGGQWHVAREPSHELAVEARNTHHGGVRLFHVQGRVGLVVVQLQRRDSHGAGRALGLVWHAHQAPATQAPARWAGEKADRRRVRVDVLPRVGVVGRVGALEAAPRRRRGGGGGHGWQGFGNAASQHVYRRRVRDQGPVPLILAGR